MPLFEDYGKADNDPGEWYQLGIEPTNNLPARVRIRVLTGDVERSLMRKHTRSEKVEGERGVRMTVPVAQDWMDNVQYQIDKAIAVVTDFENVLVLVRDREAAELWGRLIGREGSLKEGDAVDLSGHATNKVLMHVLTRNDKLRGKVLELHDVAQKKRDASIEDLGKN